MLRDTDVEVRLAAAKSLWNITKTAAAVVPTMIELLKVKETADLEAAETRRRFIQSVMEALGRKPDKAFFHENWAFVSPVVFAHYNA